MSVTAIWIVVLAAAAVVCRSLWASRRDEAVKKRVAAGLAADQVDGWAIPEAFDSAGSDDGWSDSCGGDGGGDGD